MSAIAIPEQFADTVIDQVDLALLSIMPYNDVLRLQVSVQH
jgi:hypothetical protein